MNSLPTGELTNIPSNFIDKEVGRLRAAVRQRKKVYWPLLKKARPPQD